MIDCVRGPGMPFGFPTEVATLAVAVKAHLDGSR
jgi:hypothetical protein